jgi:hypothetical protein
VLKKIKVDFNFSEIGNRNGNSLFFINKYLKLLNIKYSKVFNAFKLLKFFNNMKSKIFEKNVYPKIKNYNFIKPSISMRKHAIVTSLQRITNYGKIFATVPENYKYSKKTASFYFQSSTNLRLFLYIKFSKKFLAHFSKFLEDSFKMIIFMFKLNFGCSYNLVSAKRKLNFSMDYKFFYNIQYYLYLFFYFIRRHFYTKRKGYLNLFNKSTNNSFTSSK